MSSSPSEHPLQLANAILKFLDLGVADDRFWPWLIRPGTSPLRAT
jgi:hypothetical protein